MSLKKDAIDRPAAEHIAVMALAFLSDDPSRLQRFLDLTGLEVRSIRQAASEDQFLGAVLDHLSHDESLLILFSESHDLAPATVLAAHAMLAPPARSIP